MTILAHGQDLFGPFVEITMLPDRLVCDGQHWPFSVIGQRPDLDFHLLEEAPSGPLEAWSWSGSSYVRRGASDETVQACRKAALEDLASQRWEATQFFTYDGVRTQANNAISVISARLQLRRETGVPDEYPMKFKLSDGEFRSWDRAGEVEFGQALAAHVQGCFDIEDDLTEQIAAAETPSAIADIVEAARAGWPA